MECTDRGTALLAGYVLDLAAGDPARAHPVALFGAAASAVERRAYAPSRARGALVAGALVLGAAGGAELIARAVRRLRLRDGVALAALTWVALGGRALRREAGAVSAHLGAGELPAARARLRSLCGRDAAALSEAEIARAVVESLAENTSDAVVGALLWGAVAGPAGVTAFRAVNTLDAMFGHHTPRYEAFGWASARLDDLAGWPAARLTMLLACLLAPAVGGSPRRAWAIARRDGASHPSPNAGRAEAAFAGALDVTLGGPLAYAGRTEDRGELGDGPAPTAADVARAARLSLLVGLSAAGLAGALTRGLRP